MNTQHTPGPWEIRDYELGLKAISTPNITHYLATGIDAADARLIAAAPDLLDIVGALVALACDRELRFKKCDHVLLALADRARTAIAKATGNA